MSHLNPLPGAYPRTTQAEIDTTISLTSPGTVNECASSSTRLGAGPLTGQVLGPYRLRRPLGSGPHGTVYTAEDLVHSRRVVVKVLSPELAARGLAVRQHFLTSGMTASHCSDPGLVPVYSTGQEGDLLYMALERQSEPSLQERLASGGALPPGEATTLIKDLALLLEGLHGQGLPHGNLKLTNIWQRGDQLRLSDVGLDQLDSIGPGRRMPPPLDDVAAEVRDLRQLTMVYFALLTGHWPSEDFNILLGNSSRATRDTLEFAGLDLDAIPELCAEAILAPFRPTSPGVDSLREWAQLLERVEYGLSDEFSLPPQFTPEEFHAESQEMSESNSFSIGMQLGKCTITEWIGEGGMCTVYRAWHRSLNIPVALKILNPEFATKDNRELAKFKWEACLLARLNHPHIVRVLDLEDAHHPPYLVLEHVEGQSLAELIKENGRLAPLRAIQIVKQVCVGLAAALEIGVVHRDVNPANLLLQKNDEVKIADLGLAMLVSSNEMSQSLDQNRDKMGAGTPGYMAPEQVEGSRKGIDHRTDIYALGCTLYHALTGQLPFTGNSALEVLMKHMKEPPRDPQQWVPEIPADLSKIVLKMLAKQSSDRYQSYTDLLAALELVEMQLAPPEAAAANKKTWMGFLTRKSK